MRAAWVVMTLLAIEVAGYALMGVVAPGWRPAFMADLFTRAPVAAWLHMAGGAVALLVGAFQVDARIRSRFLRLHRWLGAAYLIGVAVGGNAALVLATGSFGGMVTHLGFGGLAIAWLGTTYMAFNSIRRRDIPAHQRWMYRSYALTLAAVTLRIYLPLAGVLGIPFAVAYRVVSWLCWVPNLLVVETWFVRRRASIAPPFRPTP